MTRNIAAQQCNAKIGATEQTSYRWQMKFGGLRMDQAKRLKGLEQENSRLDRPSRP